MFAIIRVGGKQYRVENGTQILVDRLHVEEGGAVEGVEVLMVVDGDDTRIGTPTLEVPVGVTALRHTLGKKIRVFKYKAKKNYRRRIGSRPHHTLIRIDSIDGNSTHNQPATQAAPVVETVPIVETAPVVETVPIVETAPVVETMPVVETAPVETAAPVEAETIAATPADTTVTDEAPAVVEAVVDADAKAEAVEAIEEVPGVESVEIVEDSDKA